MSEITHFTIGTEVFCSDGICGQLTRVVIDPVARTLTHLVVEPAHQRGTGRLVPLDLVDSYSDSGQIRLRCTIARFDTLENAEETQFLSAVPGEWGYGQQQMLLWPYYGLGLGGSMGMGTGGVDMGRGGTAMAAAPRAIVHDRVPLGEVEVRRGEPVHAVDGTIGRVRGLVINPSDHHVTHILLDEGHLWGRKRVAIPISAVASAKSGVQLTLSKDQVRDLPPVEVDDRN
ncbi:PRC-barrel domain-containing protein [Actinocrinis sp.]|uniref:PRC-barrel domain-containing protein n=1 Tax=Actinocrinis sp. TaxID=1920516 RepID=UPI002D475A20|nr:PRC-barrel domain-containing protein [Actinocrinis sp.]HZP52710.1 PRC-barrel domain-containing protein [Actinocrinis sp.]